MRSARPVMIMLKSRAVVRLSRARMYGHRCIVRLRADTGTIFAWLVRAMKDAVLVARSPLTQQSMMPRERLSVRHRTPQVHGGLFSLECGHWLSTPTSPFLSLAAIGVVIGGIINDLGWNAASHRADTNEAKLRTTLAKWMVTFASDALTIYQIGGGTTPERQQVADNVNTVKVKRNMYDGQYT